MKHLRPEIDISSLVMNEDYHPADETKTNPDECPSDWDMCPKK